MANNVITAYDGNGQNPITLTQLGSTNTYIDNITSIPYTITSVGNKYYYHSMYIPEVGDTDYDFIRFSFNGVTSQSLGISRVSEGSRYTEQMLPNFSDKTAQMPGSDYTLYWESFYNTKPWTLNIAFDHMTDEQMHRFRKTFNTKNLGELKFEEQQNLYEDIHHSESIEIHYLAKVQSPPQLKYICFNENGERIYKGEGTINFIAYYPFGMSQSFKDQITLTSPLPTETTGYMFTIYNLGDLPMDWKLHLRGSSAQNLTRVEYKLYVDSSSTAESVKSLTFSSPLSWKNWKDGSTTRTDNFIIINSKTNLVEGAWFNSNKLTYTGNLYNEAISAGEFFQIDAMDETKQYNKCEIIVYTKPTSTNHTITIEYNYLYL